MTGKIAVLGGYGNFGKRISRALAAKGTDVLIVGRDSARAKALADAIGPRATAAPTRVPGGLAELFAAHRPAAVVNTVGPFQGQGYETARSAIVAGVHYVDLADGRQFVCGIDALDAETKEAGVAVISGASTVPALSDAVLAEYRDNFAGPVTMQYGIAPGQRAERGRATTEGILSYVGKPLAPFPGIHPTVYGWQDLYRQDLPGLGRRWMANCDVPDLELLPERYGLRSIQFSAGLELAPLHLGLCAIGWLRRAGLPLPLERAAGPLLAASNWFNAFGTADGGMHVRLTGPDARAPNSRAERQWTIIARDGDGPHIPTIPAILIAQRIAQGTPPLPGARPCLGLVTLQDYLAELAPLRIETQTSLRIIGSEP
ncbi:MAG: saccharopine dehydrogenase NADP-binding domain-containing protein [Pseudomonadota bacterium]